MNYIFTLAWGYPALLVSTNWAMLEPSERGTSDKRLHVFAYVGMNVLMPAKEASSKYSYYGTVGLQIFRI